MQKNEISKRLHRVREELCSGSNKEFAEKLGVSPQYASAICTGHRAPRRETLERLLEVFPQVSRTWLMEGEGSMLSGGASGWTTSMSSSPEEMMSGSVTLPSELVAMFRRQAESLAEKDSQISQLVDLVEKKYLEWFALELTNTDKCLSKSRLTANAKEPAPSVFMPGRRLFKM